jgi:hypothetical protein
MSSPTRPVRRLRADDERSDEFLAECGRESVRLGLAVGWTVGIRDLKAHEPGPWKKAKPFPDPENGAAIYVGRCRTRNPIHPVGVSNIFGIEFDGDEDELRAKFEIPELPETVRVVSRRGRHHYYRPPAGRQPLKLEIAEEKVTCWDDGVLIGAGALHRSGHVYDYDGDGSREIADAPLELYEHLVRLAAETTTRFHEGLKADGPIREPGRRPAVFHFALELAHDGLDEDEIMPSMLALNRRIEPPLSDEQIRGQVRGAVVRARKKPRDPVQVRTAEEAERLLDDWATERSRGGGKSEKSGKSPDDAPPYSAFSAFSAVPHDKRAWLPPELDPAALHGPAGDYAIAAQPYTEASPAAILVCALVAFGNVAHRGPSLQVGGTIHRANEFALLIGPTSIGRKGEAMQMGKRPLVNVDINWATISIARGFGSGEAIVEAVRDSVTARDDDGIEKVVDAGALDKRLLVNEEEFAHVLAVAGREGSTLSALIRSAWDGHRLENRTKRRLLLATDAHVSLLAGITPTELIAKTTELDAANGLLNRFLLVASRRAQALPEPARIHPAFDDEWTAKFAAALRFTQQELGDGPMSRDDGASKLWHDAYMTELSVERFGLAGAVCSRAEAHALRLSMLYALLDCSAVIRLEHPEAALALWRYCEQSALLVFGDRLGDPVADAILSALRGAAEGSLTRSEINRLLSGHRRQGEIETALKVLLEAGLVSIETKTTSGRPVTRIRLTGRMRVEPDLSQLR